jgi:hypothetical protein
MGSRPHYRRSECAYIDNIESDLDSDTGIVLYGQHQRILSGNRPGPDRDGVDDNEIILNLVPVLELEPIEYRDIGSLGLP